MVTRMQPLELGRLVKNLVESTASFVSHRGTALTCEVPEQLCVVNGDAMRLEELIMILLSNALSHTSAEGHIHVALRQEGGRFCLTVEDSGSGMSPGELSYAFSLRENAAPGDAVSGAGLGLYIAQGIARLHGGTVLLRSRPGQGTKLLVSLPSARECSFHDDAFSPAIGPERILTELADLLPNEMYDRKYRD